MLYVIRRWQVESFWERKPWHWIHVEQGHSESMDGLIWPVGLYYATEICWTSNKVSIQQMGTSWPLLVRKIKCIFCRISYKKVCLYLFVNDHHVGLDMTILFILLNQYLGIVFLCIGWVIWIYNYHMFIFVQLGELVDKRHNSRQWQLWWENYRRHWHNDVGYRAQRREYFIQCLGLRWSNSLLQHSPGETTTCEWSECRWHVLSCLH